jgi:predicted ArsR family transcriptional regulator
MNATKYPNYPGAKVAGASQDAADGIAEHAETLRDRVDRLFDRCDPNGGLTADECAEQLGSEIWSVRPRLSELRRMGRIAETDQRRKNRSGMTATVWKRAVFIQPKQPELL